MHKNLEKFFKDKQYAVGEFNFLKSGIEKFCTIKIIDQNFSPFL